MDTPGTALTVREERVPAKTQPKVALALGGGGARGLAHVLMLEVFDEMLLKPSVIAGTSIGAIFGAAYAAGMSARQIRAHTEELLSQRYDFARQLFAARNEPLQRFANLLQLKSALINPEALLGFVMPSRMPPSFAGLKTPLAVVTADYHRQEQVVITEGPLQKAIAASIALPVLFAPVKHRGRVLMDGGLVNPLPFDVAGIDADITVAIDVSGAPRQTDATRVPTAFEAAIGASQMLQASIVREKMKARQPDVYVDVAVERFGVMDFRKVKDILAAAEPAKEELRQKLLRVLSAETLPLLAPPQD